MNKLQQKLQEGAHRIARELIEYGRTAPLDYPNPFNADSLSANLFRLGRAIAVFSQGEDNPTKVTNFIEINTSLILQTITTEDRMKLSAMKMNTQPFDIFLMEHGGTKEYYLANRFEQVFLLTGQWASIKRAPLKQYLYPTISQAIKQFQSVIQKPSPVKHKLQ